MLMIYFLNFFLLVNDNHSFILFLSSLKIRYYKASNGKYFFKLRKPKIDSFPPKTFFLNVCLKKNS